MSMHQTVEHSSTAPSDASDLHRRLEALRAHVGDLEPGGTADDLLSSISGAIEQVTVEHAGMAEELLGVYEQLGIVFEVTRQLPGVQTESAVIDLFVDSLSRSFQKHEVFAVHPPSQRRVPSEGQFDSFESWFTWLVDRARESASVQVGSPPGGFAPSWATEAMVGPVFAGDSFVCMIVLTHGAGVERFRAGDMLLLESLAMFCGDLIRNHRLVHELQQMSITVVRSLVNAVDQKDKYTSGHSLRVGYFATLLGEALNLSSNDLQMLRWSALLHDVGKIGIRDDVLKKKGKLTEEEMTHIKEHPVRSHEVVREVPQLVEALDGVLHHHEHYDGGGYPAGLAGEDIPMQARIIQIGDMFDALTSDRAYRRAYSWPEALDILNEESGITIDPAIQKVFDGLIREMLEDDPDGWEKMVQTANGFA